MLANLKKLGILLIFFSMPAFISAGEIDAFLQKLRTFAHSDLLLDRTYVALEGPDADLRPMIVNLQADFERSIVQGLNKTIAHSFCIIHTPAPATPLCTAREISDGLVDPAILGDPARLLTVKKRPDILRDYLQEGGFLISAYPRNGRNLRTKEQLAILDGLVEKHSDHLSLIELDCAEIPPELIGATYVISFIDGTQWGLSFQSYQANAPTDGKWAIWFGPIDDPAIAERLSQIEKLINVLFVGIPTK